MEKRIILLKSVKSAATLIGLAKALNAAERAGECLSHYRNLPEWAEYTRNPEFDRYGIQRKGDHSHYIKFCGGANGEWRLA